MYNQAPEITLNTTNYVPVPRGTTQVLKVKRLQLLNLNLGTGAWGQIRNPERSAHVRDQRAATTVDQPTTRRVAVSRSSSLS